MVIDPRDYQISYMLVLFFSFIFHRFVLLIEFFLLLGAWDYDCHTLGCGFSYFLVCVFLWDSIWDIISFPLFVLLIIFVYLTSSLGWITYRIECDRWHHDQVLGCDINWLVKLTYMIHEVCLIKNSWLGHVNIY